MAVQVFPFIYSLLFIFLVAAYSFVKDGVVLDTIDSLMYVSPIVVLAHLIYSRILRLCKWHRIACALPLFPQLVDWLDTYVFHLIQTEVYIANITIIVSMAIYLFCAYKVFFTDDGRIC